MIFPMNPITAAKLVGVLIVAGFLAWCAYTIYGWHTQAARVPALEQQIKDFDSADEKERTASDGYQKELIFVGGLAPINPAPIRLCIPAVQAGSDTESGPDGAATGTGVLPARAGKDIGGRLRELAQRADKVTAQARGLQSLHEDSH